MTRLISALVIGFSALAIVGAAPAAPPAQSADTIPKELVTLLLRGPGTYPGDNFEITIGAPANFPPELLPKGVMPAVSTASERIITVVAEAPQLTPADMIRHERELAAAGWINPSSMSMRGLVSSTMTPALQTCKGDRYATLFYSMRPAGGMYVRVSLTTDPRRGSCVAIPRPMSFFADVNVPQLFPPAGTPAMGSGSSSGNDSHDQRIRLETTLSPEEVVTHYATQLEKAGWKREARTKARGVALARLTSVSTTKESIVALVTATTLPVATQMDVSLRLLRVDPNRRFPPVPGGGVGGRIGGSGIMTTCCRP